MLVVLRGPLTVIGRRVLAAPLQPGDRLAVEWSGISPHMERSQMSVYDARKAESARPEINL